jgi:hypothetical protein
MMTRRLTLLLPGLLAGACADRPDDLMVSVSALQQSEGADTPLGDLPATRGPGKLRKAFKEGKHKELSFGLYELEPVGEVKGSLRKRAGELAIKGKEDAAVDRHKFGMFDGKKHIVHDELSGAEFMADVERFHKGKGVGRDKLLADTDYVAKAKGYARKAFPNAEQDHKLYPYRVRKFLNAEAGLDGPVTETVYQIAVALNESIDDLPVIGPGAKLAVHVDPNGDPVSHTSSLRRIKAKKKTLSGADLLAPDSARAQVEERLRARGVDLSQFRLDREEFGYFRKGRNSVQRVVAPHYAYFYEPLSGVRAKRLIESVPAVTDPETLAQLEEDDGLEAARKAELLQNLAPPSVKK